jgi:glutamine synthetase
VIGDLAVNHILPAAVNYQSKLIENIRGLNEIGLNGKSNEAQMDLVKALSSHIQSMKDAVDKMVADRKRINKIEDIREKAIQYCDVIHPQFHDIRYHVDHLEQIVDDNLWPMPKYRELLFIR